MKAITVTITPDTPELESLCDAIRLSEGNSILEEALSERLSRLVAATLNDRRFSEIFNPKASEEKRIRIEKLRAELAELEAEQ